MALVTALIVVALALVALPQLTGAQSSGAVIIKNFTFSPNPVTVSVGATVSWSNQDGVAHTATSDTGAFDAGVISPGSTSNGVAFNTPGTFAYHCSIHPFMHGVVIVEAATATAGSTPSGLPTIPPPPSNATATPSPTTAPTNAPPTATSTPAPSRSPVRLRIHVGAKPRAGRSTTIKVSVGSSAASKVGGVKVSLDGRKVGIKKVLHKTTNGKGVASFKNVKPRKRGTIIIHATKSGFKSALSKVRVL